MRLRILHKRGNQLCEMWSTEYTQWQSFKDGEQPLSADSIQFPDGTFPQKGEYIRCGSCGKPPSFADIVEQVVPVSE